ncbi:MAG TPA: hypothetical protein DHN33_07455, partial [Eubacteriaceae bacterium]|nr:hypothetical protein [Eubacteriaceae bacterium]
VFKQNCKILNKATKRLIEQGDDPLLFKNLHFSLTTEQSKQINRDETPKVIISASGMLDGGRVKHHLKHNLWKDNSALVFVGYQAPGTLGHRILNYREFGDEVRILGESIKIRNEIYQVEGFSAHGDKILLLDWIDKVKNDPLKIILVHGEVESMESMKKDIEKRFTSEVLMPDLGDTIETTYEEEVIEHEKLIEFEGADKEAVIEHLLDLMETIETKESISYDKTMDKIEEIKTLLSNRKK